MIRVFHQEKATYTRDFVAIYVKASFTGGEAWRAIAIANGAVNNAEVFSITII